MAVVYCASELHLTALSSATNHLNETPEIAFCLMAEAKISRKNTGVSARQMHRDRADRAQGNDRKLAGEKRQVERVQCRAVRNRYPASNSLATCERLPPVFPEALQRDGCAQTTIATGRTRETCDWLCSKVGRAMSSETRRPRQTQCASRPIRDQLNHPLFQRQTKIRRPNRILGFQRIFSGIAGRRRLPACPTNTQLPDALTVFGTVRIHYSPSRDADFLAIVSQLPCGDLAVAPGSYAV
jgi:hypothetical protein